MAASDAPARHATRYDMPDELELVVTRTFDAPRALVWAAFTDPRHVPRWQTGPEGVTMPVCEIDLRPGGTWRYVWRHPHGREASATGTYREVEPPARFVFVTTNGGEENTHTTTFVEENGRTTVTVVQRYATTASRDQALRYAKLGLESGYARLDAHLASLA